MADTPNLGLERLVEGQASGETTHNQAINKLDSLVMPSIKDRDLLDPPGAPSEGDRYLIDGVGINDWVGEDDNIAIYYSGWYFVEPKEGWVLWVDDEDVMIIYDGGSWNAFVTTNATEGAAGVAEIATTAEAQAQADDTRITTPAKVKDIFEKRIVYVVKAATETLRNSTTLQDDDDLLFPIGANEVWHCRALLFVRDETTGQTAHFKFRWEFPDNNDVTHLSGYYMLGDTAVDDVQNFQHFGLLGGTPQEVVISPTNDGRTPLIIDFLVVNGATPGDAQLRWAQNVLDAAEDIHVYGIATHKSWLVATRIA